MDVSKGRVLRNIIFFIQNKTEVQIESMSCHMHRHRPPSLKNILITKCIKNLFHYETLKLFVHHFKSFFNSICSCYQILLLWNKIFGSGSGIPQLLYFISEKNSSGPSDQHKDKSGGQRTKFGGPGPRTSAFFEA